MDDPGHPFFWAGMILLAAGLFHGSITTKGESFVWLWFVGAILLCSVAIALSVVS